MPRLKFFYLLYLLLFTPRLYLPFAIAFRDAANERLGGKMLRHVSDDARATTWFLVTRTVHGLLQFSTRTTFPSSTELMFPPGRCDGCFDSRYWNSIDGEKILIISPAVSLRESDEEIEEKNKKIKWAITWKWDRSRYRLEKDDLARMWTFIHIYVNFYLHWQSVYLLGLFCIYFV